MLIGWLVVAVLFQRSLFSSTHRTSNCLESAVAGQAVTSRYGAEEMLLEEERVQVKFSQVGELGSQF